MRFGRHVERGAACVGIPGKLCLVVEGVLDKVEFGHENRPIARGNGEMAGSAEVGCPDGLPVGKRASLGAKTIGGVYRIANGTAPTRWEARDVAVTRG